MKKKLSDNPFLLNIEIDNPIKKAAFYPVKRIIEKIFLLETLGKAYEELKQQEPNLNEYQFSIKALQKLDIRYEVNPEETKHIPQQGRLIIVANHPFGAIESLILLSILHTIRVDVKILANYIVKRIPDLKELFISVDPFERETSKQFNIKGLRQALKWLHEDHVLITFPAGEVAHLILKEGKVTDPKWHPNIGRIVHKTQSPVLPIYFVGFNSLLFQLAGFVHPRLRTALIPRELLKKADKTIHIRIGHPIPYSTLSKYTDPETLTAFLRERTYLLGESSSKKEGKNLLRFFIRSKKPALEPLIDPIPSDLIEQELNSLPPYAHLLKHQSFYIYATRAKYIPYTLKEIGRLREMTFRETGEGTGKALDIDQYDADYFQLFIWCEKERQIIGGYRLGPVDIIIPQKGLEGLYTHSLFHYDRRLIERISPALEIGRSFVIKAYQKQFAPLYLLWKGIATFIAKYPQYRFLFGPVSISKEYSTYSRQLLVTFLEQYALDKDLSRLIKPKAPFSTFFLKRKAKKMVQFLYDLQDVSSILNQLEQDMKGVPVLLRHYLNLGGKILAFNVDKEFNDVLDALICVDLFQTPKPLLERFFEPEQLRHFYDFHNYDPHAYPTNVDDPK